RIRGFHNFLNDSKPTSSLSSTATCIRSLSSVPFNRKKLEWSVLREELTRREHGEEGGINTTGLQPYNPYTLGHVLPMLRAAGFQKGDPIVTGCLKQMQSAVAKG